MFSSGDLTRILGYVHLVAPHILSIVQEAATIPPSTELKLSVVLKSIEIMDVLLGLADEDNRKFFFTSYMLYSRCL